MPSWLVRSRCCCIRALKPGQLVSAELPRTRGVVPEASCPRWDRGLRSSTTSRFSSVRVLKTMLWSGRGDLNPGLHVPIVEVIGFVERFAGQTCRATLADLRDAPETMLRFRRAARVGSCLLGDLLPASAYPDSASDNCSLCCGATSPGFQRPFGRPPDLPSGHVGSRPKPTSVDWQPKER
jgi:hypothetical protein